MKEFFLGNNSGFRSASTLTSGQSKVLSMYNNLTQQYMPGTTGVMASLAMSPKSAYAEMPGMEDAFRQGIVAPLTRRMMGDLRNIQHGTERHSSARKSQEKDTKLGYMDQISGLRYNQMMQERQMQQSALENAFARQQNALSMMNNLYGTGLNRNAVQNQYTAGSTGLVGAMLSSLAGKSMGALTSGLFGG